MKQIAIHAVELRDHPVDDEKADMKMQYHITLCSKLEKQVMKYSLWGKLF